MTKIDAVCVYCGSNQGTNPAYIEAAEVLGKQIATRNLRLVYGGGTIGLMGIIAKTALQHGGEVTGIIPEFLESREIMLKDVTELVVTKDMHERKRLMFNKSDAFIALPGGIGTLEELVEMMTWAQLGRHRKPILLANIGNFWDPLLELLDHMIEEEFIRPQFKVNYLVEENVSNIMDRLLGHENSMSSQVSEAEEKPTPIDLL